MTGSRGKSTDKMRNNSYGPQTFGKVLALLECFSLHEPELSAIEIGNRLSISTSSLYRYLLAMVNEGYLVKDPHTGLYTIGLHLVELADIALGRIEVRRHGQSILHALSARLKMNTSMGILYQGDAFHIAFSLAGVYDDWINPVIGRRAPAHCTAMGKVLLSGLPLPEAHAIINKYGWRPMTERSIQDFARLDAELREIGRTGYAFNHGETGENSWAVAAPIFQQGGKLVAAMSASSGDGLRPKDPMQATAEIIAHAKHLSTMMGYVSPGYPTMIEQPTNREPIGQH